jgi:hypothetical protein
MLQHPIVLLRKAVAPIAVLSVPVVFEHKVLTPIAIF